MKHDKQSLYRLIAVGLLVFPVICFVVLGVLVIYRVDTPAFLSADSPQWMSRLALGALYGMQVGGLIGWPVAVYLFVKAYRNNV